MSQTLPVLPPPLALPMALIPKPVHSHMIAHAISLALSQSLRDGELDFLQGKSMNVRVEDAGFSFALTLVNGRIVASRARRHDMTISGTVYDFLLLVSRREDADTLFFQRRLKMEGETDLGLYLKNFLDGMDVDSLPFYATGNRLLRKGVSIYERVLGS